MSVQVAGLRVTAPGGTGCTDKESPWPCWFPRLAPERRQSWETTEDFIRRYGHRDFLGGETVVVLFSGRVFGRARALA